jgi:hypothetical protein
MNRFLAARNIPASVKIVAVAVTGAVGGLVATALALGSLEFAIVGGIAGAVSAMIIALPRVERAER